MLFLPIPLTDMLEEDLVQGPILRAGCKGNALVLYNMSVYENAPMKMPIYGGFAGGGLKYPKMVFQVRIFQFLTNNFFWVRDRGMTEK